MYPQMWGSHWEMLSPKEQQISLKKSWPKFDEKSALFLVKILFCSSPKFWIVSPLEAACCPGTNFNYATPN